MHVLSLYYYLYLILLESKLSLKYIEIIAELFKIMNTS